MAFDSRWEEIFANRAWGKYPCEEVIRFTARNFYKAPDRKQIRILDLGCGGGATAWYLAREGFDCWGVDGSPSAIRQCEELLRRDGLSAQLRVEDFAKLSFADASFDAVYDLNSIQHNRFEDIQRVYREVFRVLKPGGFLFSMSLSDQTSVGAGDVALEERTYSSLSTLQQPVLVHLFHPSDFDVLLKDFEPYSIGSNARRFDDITIEHLIVSAKKR